MRYSMSPCSESTLQDPTHVVNWGELVVDADGTFEEGVVLVMDS